MCETMSGDIFMSESMSGDIFMSESMSGDLLCQNLSRVIYCDVVIGGP